MCEPRNIASSNLMLTYLNIAPSEPPQILWSSMLTYLIKSLWINLGLRLGVRVWSFAVYKFSKDRLHFFCNGCNPVIHFFFRIRRQDVVLVKTRITGLRLVIKKKKTAYFKRDLMEQGGKLLNFPQQQSHWRGMPRKWQITYSQPVSGTV